MVDFCLGPSQSLIEITYLLIHEASTGFHSPLPRGQLNHALMPRADVRCALPDLIPGLHQNLVQAVVPRHERHVGKGHLVTDQPLGVSRLGSQDPLNDTKHALDLVGVPLDGGREFLWVQVLEPAALAEVRALAAHLEVQPLVTVVALLQSSVRDVVGGGVVLLCQVLVDGPRFPERQARVRVLDRWHPAVGVDVGEGLLLDVVETERLDLIIEAQLLKNEDRLWCSSDILRHDMR